MPEDDSTKRVPDAAAPITADKPAHDKSAYDKSAYDKQAPERPAHDKRLEKRRSWLDRLSSAISGEPDNQDDLIELLRDVHVDGVIDADTLRIMEGAVSISRMTVGDIMVSRAQMVVLPVDGKFLSLMKQVVESGHSRFPVHGEDRDEILGILLAKDLLRGVVADNGPGTMRELLRPAVLVPETKRLDVLLREFRQSRNHMAIVIDEYGGVAGLVTIEDVLEQIVGEIDDEHDDAQDPNALIAAQADGQYLVDALTPIGDFNARFGADFTDDEYDTIGGLITAAIGHLPEAGEELTLGRFGFRVARADARRLHTLHVSVHGS
jgi:magnesium and cobalt transporter